MLGVGVGEADAAVGAGAPEGSPPVGPVDGVVAPEGEYPVDIGDVVPRAVRIDAAEAGHRHLVLHLVAPRWRLGAPHPRGYRRAPYGHAIFQKGEALLAQRDV